MFTEDQIHNFRLDKIKKTVMSNEINYKKLPERFKTEWLKALRSGKYKQGKAYLYNSDNDSYCCLGVAGVICGISDYELNGKGLYSKYYFAELLNDLKEKGLPEQLIGTIQTDDSNRYIDINPTVSVLVKMNDEYYTFEEIADWIEKNL